MDLLCVGGIDAYDAWASGDEPFDGPTVVEAAQLGSQLLFTRGFVRGS